MRGKTGQGDPSKMRYPVLQTSILSQEHRNLLRGYRRVPQRVLSCNCHNLKL